MRSAWLCLLLLVPACDDGGRAEQKAKGASKPSEIKRAVEKAVAQTEDEDEQLLDRDRLSPALKLLPAGSTLLDVRIPRYDEQRRRAALLRADVLEVVSDDRFTSDNIEMRRFSKEEKEVLRVRMGAADYLAKPGLLEAREGLTVTGEHLEAAGSSGVFLLDSRQGFVRGPITTSFTRPLSKKETNPDGNAPASSPEEPLPPPIAVLVPEFLEPEPLSPAQLEEIERLLASRTKSVLADRAPTRELVTRSEQLTVEADVGLQSFTRQVQRGNLLAPASSPAPVPPGERREGLEPRQILVTSAGGMYIDGERGHLEYLRDVTVVEESFALSCSDRLILFFETAESAGSERPDLPDDFSDLKAIVATGGVRLERVDPRGKRPPVVATAETVIVDYKAGDFVLQGGAPAIRQGLNELRAEEPNLYLRYYANGNIFAEEGRWTTVGDLSSLRDRTDEENEKAEVGGEGNERERPETAPEAVALDEPGAEPPAEGEGEPETITVTCTGGIYFDAKAGQLVYLGEIEIVEPRFRISCTKELNAFLRRKPDAEAGELTGLEAFSDLDWIVASGKVTMVQQNPKDDGKRSPVTAAAEHVILDARHGDIVLRGGSPTVRQGANALQAGEPDLYLRFYENGSLFAEPGTWTTTGDMANLNTKPGESPKPKEMITVTSRGGFFFDSLKGHVVYLGDVNVQEPRFRLVCKERLMVILQEREAKEGERLEGPEAFSDVKGIRAEGGVRVIRPNPDGKGEPLVASAEIAKYLAATGEMGLEGGYPSIRMGRSNVKAREPGLFIRFYKDGRYYASKGNWEWDVQTKEFEDLRKRDE